jgi:hypothetical protein
VSEIRAEIVAEGERLVARAATAGVVLRLLGGVAVFLRARGGLPQALARPYADLDVLTARGGSAAAARFLRGQGYEPHVAFNALHGQERLLFFDEGNARQVDVFVGAFRMSHAIPLEGRIELEPVTLPLAELLLTKLQIAELNEKDVRDALALLHGHALGESDGETLNAARIAEACASDWGLWRTFTRNLASVRTHLDRYELSCAQRAEVLARLDALLERIEREPKSRGWKLRARIGERKRWYELPEEVAGGP